MTDEHCRFNESEFQIDRARACNIFALYELRSVIVRLVQHARIARRATSVTRARVILGHQLVGSGPEKVIVFNDWLASCESWTPMHPYLDKTAFTYAFVDLRGYGRSIDLTGQYTFEESAQDAFALADHLNWKRFHVVGFSMTGMLIERMVLDQPARIVSQIAVGPVSAAGVPMAAADKSFFLSTISEDDAVRELAARICDRKLSHAWLDFKLELERATRNPKAAPHYLERWTNPRFAFADEVAKARPAAPILVVVGEWDHEAFLEPRMRETYMAWHPKAELAVIRNCGHCPMQETPVYLATLMEAFMARNAAARSSARAA